jgi:cytochrome c-type biogenesis protein CcmH/NrfG
LNSSGARLRKFWPVVAIVVLVPLAALGIYAVIGTKQAAGPASTANDVATLHARTATQGGQGAGDLGQAVERLQARLAANPNDPDGWRLLAQSYQYLGRPADAAEANRRADEITGKGGSIDFAPGALAAVSEAGDGAMPMPAPAPAMRPTNQPDAAISQLVQSAQDYRRRRDFRQANQAFAELARRGQMDANLWADYADSLGGERGRLDEQAERCISAALQLDPRHPKALWLLGSVQTQRGDFRAALGTWQKLASILPGDSPDARIIAANIAEARGRISGAAASAPPAATRAASLSGTVQLDPRWRARVPQGTTLFVFARAADERGPPLAVLRTTAGTWPLSFKLDDANAMLPDRKLSDFTRVVVEARISQSGNPIAQPGDLQAVSAVLDPRSAAPVQLIINTEVRPSAVRGG